MVDLQATIEYRLSITPDILCIFHGLQASSQVQKAKISPSSDEYVLDQLSQCEEKLLKLLEELDQSGKDVSELAKQMEEEEVRGNVIFLHLSRFLIPLAQNRKAPLQGLFVYPCSGFECA
jgi:hypothetical protein